jgi:two-component system LytT family sensor kinase
MLNRLNHITPELLLQARFQVLRHLIILCAIALITVNVLWDEPTVILSERYVIWGIYFLLFVSVVYTNMYVLVPRFLLRNKIKSYLLFAALLMLFFLVGVGSLQSLADDSIPLRTPPMIGLLSGLTSFILFIMGLTSLQLFKYRIENQQKISDLQNAGMAIELANLQNQINPHFLFNMLNNANILVVDEPQKSTQILSRLNDLLQYQVDKSSAASVSLQEDIMFLRDFLELEKSRRDRFEYKIEIEGDINITVPPLLFIPFVENAVKHNPDNDAYVNIRFQKINNELLFECWNNKPGIVTVPKGGIGLANVKKRMNLLFENKYNLDIQETANSYAVQLKLIIV